MQNSVCGAVKSHMHCSPVNKLKNFLQTLNMLDVWLQIKCMRQREIWNEKHRAVPTHVWGHKGKKSKTWSFLDNIQVFFFIQNLNTTSWNTVCLFNNKGVVYTTSVAGVWAEVAPLAVKHYQVEPRVAHNHRRLVSFHYCAEAFLATTRFNVVM